ncbi:winged helix-turn-helix domain-containing protein [Haloferax namakaokahaiae]|uniref:Winged helix-turn-helix domain-containing protein n=1 Tax=Haloferax namakaokahaiae TaxID=1748331 RepID=A0ABD5ZFF8_9EURY
MEKALWYLLAGTRGGTTRAKLIRSLSERPRNANQLSESLDIDYNTVRYHLDLLVEHDIVEKGEESYGTMYFLTDRFEQHRDQFETILKKIE